MKKNKALVIAILSCFLFTACSTNVKDTNFIDKNESSEEQSNLNTIYQEYLSNGGTMTYDDWLKTIKGEKGDTGPQGEKGDAGKDGQDGFTPIVGYNGNWWIGGVDTGIKAVGVDGQDGLNGNTPYIGNNGNWWIDGVDTGFKATGENGQDGIDGQDGKDGTSIYSSTQDPDVSFGKDGDSFVNVTSGDYFIKKNGSWVKIGNIKQTVFYTVTFDSNGGSTTPNQQIVERGGMITCPSAPYLYGCEFAGWYIGDYCMGIDSDSTGFQLYRVVSDITLVAHWNYISPYGQEHYMPWILNPIDCYKGIGYPINEGDTNFDGSIVRCHNININKDPASTGTSELPVFQFAKKNHSSYPQGYLTVSKVKPAEIRISVLLKSTYEWSNKQIGTVFFGDDKIEIPNVTVYGPAYPYSVDYNIHTVSLKINANTAKDFRIINSNNFSFYISSIQFLSNNDHPKSPYPMVESGDGSVENPWNVTQAWEYIDKQLTMTASQDETEKNKYKSTKEYYVRGYVCFIQSYSDGHDSSHPNSVLFHLADNNHHVTEDEVLEKSEYLRQGLCIYYADYITPFASQEEAAKINQKLVTIKGYFLNWAYEPEVFQSPVIVSIED